MARMRFLVAAETDVSSRKARETVIRLTRAFIATMRNVILASGSLFIPPGTQNAGGAVVTIRIVAPGEQARTDGTEAKAPS